MLPFATAARRTSTAGACDQRKPRQKLHRQVRSRADFPHGRRRDRRHATDRRLRVAGLLRSEPGQRPGAVLAEGEPPGLAADARL